MAKMVPVHEAKAKLSEILRRVKRGRTVTISEHGRAIARVVPIRDDTDLGARLASLEREGLVAKASGGPASIRPIARRPGALRRFLGDRG